MSQARLQNSGKSPLSLIKLNGSVNLLRFLVDESTRRKGRFAWVRRLIQNRNGNPINNPSTNNVHPVRKDNNRINVHDQNRTRQGSNVKKTTFDIEQNSTNIIPNNESLKSPTTRSYSSTNNSENDHSTTRSIKDSVQTPSTLSTKPDNISTLPMISTSTASIRSSTFSDHSEPSTSVTVISDHQTVYTNASTMGIPPASIMDRTRERERDRVHQPFSVNSYMTTNNNSVHTVSTTVSRTS